ncbi:hypothetical protein AB0I81_22705 [Nonomuraea sp. NPDC050404]|uniref:hypothetical protein n=1 Tax=Nonomuraea sp. NPDC050404 TaxID=3155783 RepID=UPI0033DE1E21
MTVIQTTEGKHLRMVLPVLVDYVNHIGQGVDLYGLRDQAAEIGAVEHLPLIDALIAAWTATDGKAGTTTPDWREPGEDMAAYKRRLQVLAEDAMVEVVKRPNHPDVPLATREAMAEAVVDALTANGYVVTYVGGAAARPPTATSSSTAEGS